MRNEGNEETGLAVVGTPSHLKTVDVIPADLVDAFLSGKSKRTLKAYGQDLEDFRSFVGVPTLDEAARVLLGNGHGRGNALAHAYRTHLMERGLSPATVNRRLAALRSMVKLAKVQGIVPWTLDVSSVKAESYRDTRGPGVNGVQALMVEAQKGTRDRAVRDYAILRLLYDLALRRGEVVSLDVEDVDLERGTLSVLGKGRTQKRLLSIPEPTRAALGSWLDLRGTDEGPLFVNFDRAGKGGRLTGTSVYRLVRDLGRKVGLKTRPHGLRHTSVTEAVKAAQAKGYGLEEVLDFSRHANVKTLMVYRDRERNLQGELASLVARGV